MNEEEDDLDNKVANWLESQGYPLEMAVAAEFQKNGFGVHQSSYFKDPETGKPREIDIVATKGMYTGRTFAHIRFVIECKKSKKKPWVAFTRSNQIVDWEYSHWYTTNERGWHYVLNACIEGKFDNHDLTYHKRDEIGYGLTQAFTSGEDVTFKALSSVGNCAASYIEAAKSKNFDVVEVVIPVIVIEGELFEAQLQGEQLVVKKTEETVVQWDTVIGDEAGFTVHVLTANALKQFAQNAGNTANAICSDWEECLDDVLDQISDWIEDEES